MRSIVLIFLLPLLVHAQPSRIDLVTISSPALGTNKQFNIYLPTGYESADIDYPVLYLFRGHEREWANPLEDNSRAGRSAKTIADQLCAGGAIGPVILVMPGMSSSDNSQPALAVDFLQPERASGLAGIGNGQFERYLIDDLIPFIDANYRTLPARHLRGVDGFSLGGITSLMAATRNPNYFISAGSYDGTLMFLDLDDPRFSGNLDDGCLFYGFADPIFGLPRNSEFTDAHNASSLIFHADSTRRRLYNTMQFLLHSVGDPISGNYAQQQQLSEILEQTGSGNAFDVLSVAPDAVHNWWFADEHLLQSLPLHWQRFMESDTLYNTISFSLNGPSAGAEVSGIVNIGWQSAAANDSVNILLAYSNDDGQTWHKLIRLQGTNGQFAWDTQNVPDGTRYLFRAWLDGKLESAVAGSAGRFTINNPGNANPDIVLLDPVRGETLSGNYVVSWYGADADGDSLQFSAFLSTDEGETWTSLFSGRTGDRQFVWQTSTLNNSQNYRLLLAADDGQVTVTDTSAVFSIFNERIVVEDSLLQHVGGNSTAKIQLNISDESALTGDNYEIHFDDSSFTFKTYSVQNMNSGQWPLVDIPVSDGNTEGPQFEGLRLQIADFSTPQFDPLNSGWQNGNSDLQVSVSLPEIDLGTEILYGVPLANDYQLTITTEIADTSSDAFGALPVAVYFSLFNVSENRIAEFIFLDNGDQHISLNEELYILGQDSAGQTSLTWAMFSGGDVNTVLPLPGDNYLLATNKPLTSLDVYQFSGITGITNARDNIAQNFQLSQNYPNPFNPRTTISLLLIRPSYIRIDIFDLQGRKVSELFAGTMKSGTHQFVWKSRDKYGVAVSSGVYFLRASTGNQVEMRKMILLR